MEIRDALGDDNPVYQDAFEIRKLVFSIEQNVPLDEEIDEYESIARHFVLYDNGAPVACARLLYFGDSAKVGRVAVLEQHRRKGFATIICEHCINVARKNGMKNAFLHAQTQAMGFYQTLGFAEEGDVFLEDGIDHIRMTMPL